MTGQYIICRLPELKPIEGADNIVQATIFGETIIVSKDYKEGHVGLLFDCETVLSPEYLSNNNLYRHSDLNINKEKGGYFEDSGRVRPIRLKGVRVSGFWMPLSSLDYIGKFDLPIKEGEQGNDFKKHPICSKYVPPFNKQGGVGGKQGKSREQLTPHFKEHFDTDQLMRNLDNIQDTDTLIITEKLHGTSVRFGTTQVLRNKNWFERLLNWVGISTSNTEYKFVVGSRRVVKSIDGDEHTGPGYYDNDIWTLSANKFKDKLHKGETIYAEIVGYLPTEEPIMPNQPTSKLKPFFSKSEYKEYSDKFGETVEFGYGCNKGEHDIYVYRITMTSEEGISMDLSWEQVKRRCEVMGIKHVPDICKTSKQSVEETVNQLTDSDCLVDSNTMREGVCVRIENGSLSPIVYKHKSFIFKCVEGIIKDTGKVTMEEQQ